MPSNSGGRRRLRRRAGSWRRRARQRDARPAALQAGKAAARFSVTPRRAPHSDRAANLEADRAFRLVDRNDPEVEHMRPQRSAPQLGERRLELVGGPRDHHLDRPVAPVAHPAGYAEAQRDPAREVAVADALDVTLDDDAPDQQRLFVHGQSFLR